VCGKEQQLALDEIKNNLTNPPILVPPQQGKPFRLYLSTDDMVIGLALIQEFEGKERVIYYLVEDWWTLRQGIRQLKNYAYAYTFLMSN